MTEVFVMPLVGPSESVLDGLTLEVLAELPVVTLERVVRGYGRLVLHRGQVVVRPDDVESGLWITKTLNYLGIPIAWWGDGNRALGNGMTQGPAQP